MRTVVVVALVGLTSACVSSGKFRNKSAEADELRAHGAELEAALARTNGELEKRTEEARALQAQVAELSSSRGTLEARVNELSTSKSKLETVKAELEKKSSEYEKMANALRGEIDAGRVELTELRGKMTVKMKDKILFSSGSATLGKPGKSALAAVAEVLRGVEGKVIRVEGHTDNVPLGRGGFVSNWDLSVARALAVVRFLQEAGVEPTRLAAAGYGEYQPIAPNDTPEGRSQNRRIEIVLAPGEAPVPGPAPAPAAL
ncbi:OmpA family protein [Anaeromyxobacter sp. SG17]|uniref:OmpA/MotB family protein n=1 Tax=Anaeromyxobacter sp. SG17 TaxID=2925405 RepID=UPI001F596816|nr:OmpA family protein [Anaeromyxobacter sp. SG17]